VTVVVLPGDGIGPEVMREALRALEKVAPGLELEEHAFGAQAIRDTGDSLPEETLAACKASEAVLKGPIGDPEFDAAEVRPEQGMLRLRAELDVYANLRPSEQGQVNVLIVRELVGGLYFGERGVREDGTVYDTMEYHPRQVERIARRGFELARARHKRVVSVDKANVLDTSRMWRRVVTEVAADYEDVELEHMLVDNAAMQLVLATDQFDVIVTENMFGDILSDLAASLTGGIGLAPSASLSDTGPGLFEPVHGSAPDIAGKAIANPIAQIWTGAMMLDHLGHEDAGRAVVDAIERVVQEGKVLTRDLGGTASTSDVGKAVSSLL
jgi:3-isopropylmalate dehydrogenase